MIPKLDTIIPLSIRNLTHLILPRLKFQTVGMLIRANGLKTVNLFGLSFFYDKYSDAWYWSDEDGFVVRNKDVFVPLSNQDRSQGKWVRLNRDGRMIKREDYRYNSWYYFDTVSGAMKKA